MAYEKNDVVTVLHDEIKLKENKVKNHLLRIGKFSYDEIEKSKEEMIGMCIS